METLPGLYFRLRDKGATVFRVETAGPGQRLDLRQIATVNLRNGEIRPQPGDGPDAAEQAGIAAWLAARRATLAARERDEVAQTIERLNQTAHWAQSRATADEIAAVSDALLLAMHDLRSVLIRRKSEG